MKKDFPILSLKVDGPNVVSIRLNDDAPENLLFDTLNELLPLVAAKINSEKARGNYFESGAVNLLPGILALDLKSKLALENTVSLLSMIPDIANGDITPAEAGFPEFEYEASGIQGGNEWS